MIEQWIAQLDTHVSRFVDTQTSDDDRRSLLAIHDADAAR